MYNHEKVFLRYTDVSILSSGVLVTNTSKNGKQLFSSNSTVNLIFLCKLFMYSRNNSLSSLSLKIRNVSSIVSAIGSYLTKYLLEIMKPLATNKYTVKDSFNFVDKLMSLSSVPFMCSFEIVSLYTNIGLPIDETINICIDKLFKDNNTVQNRSHDQFGNLLNYCVKQNHFVHNGILYDQIDGVAMGSPLGFILTNAFISNLEVNMNNFTRYFKPKI